MLATKNWVVGAFEPKAANDQLAIISVKSLEKNANQADSAVQITGDTAVDVKLDTSWLQDWTQCWSSVGASMLDAALTASATAMTATHATPNRTEPAASEVSLWAQPPRTVAPRSWYRPPTPNLLDPTTWGFPAPLAIYGVPMTLPSALPGVMGFNSMPSPMLTPMFAPLYSMMAQAMWPSAMGGWSGNGFGQGMFGAFGQGYGSGMGLPFSQPNIFQNPFVRQPENPITAWMSSFAPQPVNPWAKLNSAMTDAFTPARYSTYRSDSGHAVAQIAIAEAKLVSSSAEEATKAIWNLFAWPVPDRTH